MTNLSNGELDSAAAIATVTLEASDDPYGSFAFAPTSQPLRVGEGIAVAMVTIIREFGTAASVEVSFRTLASSTLPGELQSRAGRCVCACVCVSVSGWVGACVYEYDRHCMYNIACSYVRICSECFTLSGL